MTDPRPEKQHRRVVAIEGEMGRVIKRLKSLSLAMTRADAAWEAYHREFSKVVESAQSEDELIASLDRQSWRVENNDFLRADAHLTMWLALLNVVVEGWRKWRFFDVTADALIASPYVEELKQYRHAIFHASEFDHPAVMQFTGTTECSRWSGDLADPAHRSPGETAARSFGLRPRARVTPLLMSASVCQRIPGSVESFSIMKTSSPLTEHSRD